MNFIEIEKKDIFDYIIDTLSSSQKGTQVIENAKYHHNTRYRDGVSVLENGILSIDELNRLKIRTDSNETIEMLGDTSSHINGKDGISLSVVGLTDLYKDEYEYNPFDTRQLDILISSDIKASRTTLHYGNEFIANKKISREDIRSIDIRLLKYIRNIIKKDRLDQIDYEKTLEKYNSLINIFNYINKEGILLPVREMSDESNRILDVDKLKDSPILLLKK